MKNCESALIALNNHSLKIHLVYNQLSTSMSHSLQFLKAMLQLCQPIHDLQTNCLSKFLFSLFHLSNTFKAFKFKVQKLACNQHTYVASKNQKATSFKFLKNNQEHKYLLKFCNLCLLSLLVTQYAF